MRGGSAAAVIEMDYVPAPESTDQLSLRVPKSVKARLQQAVRLWKALALARGDDPTNVDLTHVVTQMLKDATIATFKSYGGVPKDEAGWKLLEEAISKGTSAAHADDHKSKK